MQSSINRLKFGGDLAVLDGLERLFADGFSDSVGRGDSLVCVPPAPGKLRERGFDLAYRLGSRLSRHSGARIDSGLLLCTGTGVEQAGLRFADREKNAYTRFRAGGGTPKATNRYILIDDVCTTTATLRRCADILKSGGAAQITALTLARTVMEP